MSQDPKNKTRSFGAAGFPYAGGYPPRRRGAVFLAAGGCACIALIGYFLADHWFFSRGFTSPGPLSSNHASFETDCSLCHTATAGVDDRKCEACHEKTNDRPGVYTLAAHYVYRSGDPARATTVHTAHADAEVACASCHPEHLGRTTPITDVPDRKCTTCHEYGALNDDHPEFQFIRDGLPDDSTLIFTHLRHTRFVIDDIRKRTGGVYVEKACLYCHVPMPDGRTFQPIAFDAHCASCHLGPAGKTSQLPVAAAGDTLSAGVLTLETIRKTRGPLAPWVYFQNPNEFSLKLGGAKVVKSPVYHRDPWVLENLRWIRSRLFEDGGAGDLLPSSGVGSKDEVAKRYSIAVTTLRDQMRGLGARPEPEVQRELAVLDSLLDVAQRRIAMPARRLDGRAFSMSPRANRNLTLAQRDELFSLASDLAKPCLVCHLMQDGSMTAVRAAQGTLLRAEFNHRAHIFQRRCLDCHTTIPIAGFIGGDSTVSTAMDRSAVHNVPAISNCLECHNDGRTADACSTCHMMHPNKTLRANLELFVLGE